MLVVVAAVEDEHQVVGPFRGHLRFRDSGLGFWVWGLGFRVQGWGFRV